MPGDGAHAVLGEEPGDAARRRPTIDEHDVGGHGLRRCAAERDVVLVQDAEAGAHVHANGRRGEAAVGGADRHGVDRAAGSRDAPVAGPCLSVVAGGDDREHVEIGRPGDRAWQRAVRERRVRLDHPDEGDARGVEHVAVVVGIDGRLEPGEDLIRARVDAVAALGVRLPAADADRKDRGARRDPVQAVRTLGPGDDPGELGRVALRPTRNRRVRLRDSAAAGVDDVDAREHAAAQVGMGRIDARVEQRDRDAGAVETRDLEIGDRRRKHAALRLGGLRWIGDPHRVDAHDLAVAIEQRSGRGIQTGREAVEHACVAVLGSDPRPDRSEPREELLLLRDRSGRPRAHLRLRRSSSSRPHPRCQ